MSITQVFMTGFVILLVFNPKRLPSLVSDMTQLMLKMGRLRDKMFLLIEHFTRNSQKHRELEKNNIKAKR